MKKVFTLLSYIQISLLLLSAFPSVVSATSLLPISLQQLSTRATLIFHAEVIDNQTRRDPQSGQVATFTEFRIIEQVKGETGDTHIIKQLGGYDKSTGNRLRVHGIPLFETGKQYVVFLPDESSLGFCSPLGLHQGSFSVTNHGGEVIVSNGGNLGTENTWGSTSGLTSNTQNIIHVPLAIRAQNPTQSRLDDFINTVRAYNIR